METGSLLLILLK